MASVAKKSEIEVVVEALALKQFYPSKLTRDTFYEISSLSLQYNDVITQENIAWHFLNRLMRLDYNARNIKVATTQTYKKPMGYIQRRKKEREQIATSFHPLDILVAVFRCCDQIAKQDFVKYLWTCKLAVPFILNIEGFKRLRAHKWPLRSLITLWQGFGDELPQECHILEHPMYSIGFMRIGNLDESKSALINGLIYGTEKNHHMFFHRDLPGSKEKRSSIVDGLVELGWYFPKGTEKDVFTQCLSFYNLRGNAIKCPDQRYIFSTVMNISIILSNTDYLVSEKKMFREMILQSNNSVILILTDHDITQKEMILEEFLSSVGNIPDGKFEILPFEKYMMAEKIEMLSDHINKMVKGQKNSIESFCDNKLVRKVIDIDELTNKDTLTGIESADAIIKYITSLKQTDRKNKILPLQGKLWSEWTKLEIEKHRLDNLNKEDTVGSYRNKLEEQKIECRQKQMQHIENSLPTVMAYFIACMFELSGEQRKIFLRTLKLGLDYISRKSMQPYYTQYKQLLDKKAKASKSENEALSDKLEKLDAKKLEQAFGLEHFIREIGQVFEASCVLPTSVMRLSNTKTVRYESLPNIAAKILLDGYPIEIMDGDVAFVQEEWVREVLRSTHSELVKANGKNPIIHIISVLGIQSSGKSTLLNAIFGLQFGVSVGRCTKGVFMQMVKISQELRDELGCDYLLIIDTEGLRAAQISSKRSVKFDNELSCFAIGLADTTIVNLMGENAKYLEENLPIVVHAFLRMDMVGLRPRCSIVHHNVDRRNKSNLMEQNRILETVLNELTEKACNIEKLNPKQFKDIIKFDISKDTDYIAALFEGEQPMTSINTGYTEGCNELRKKVLRRIKNSSRNMDVLSFAKHLWQLWDAIKSDQFVFEFKSTLETEARLQLDSFYRQLYSSMLDDIGTIGKTAINDFSKCSRKSKTKSKLSQFLESTTESIDKKIKLYRNKFVEFMKDHIHQHNEARCTDLNLQKLETEGYEAKADCLNQLKSQLEDSTSEKETLEVQNITSEDINDLRIIISSSKHKLSTLDNDGNCTYIWRVWRDAMVRRNLKKEKGEYRKPNFVGDAEKLLYDLMKKEQRLLEERLKAKPLQLHSLQDFQITKDHIRECRQFSHGSQFQQYGYSVSEDCYQIVKQATSAINYHLKSYVNEKKRYSKFRLKQTLVQGKRFLDKQQEIYTVMFEVDLSIAIASHVISEFSEMYSNIENKESIVKSLERSKDSFLPIILDILREKESNIIHKAKTHIVDAILCGIVDQCVPMLVQQNKASISFKKMCKNDLIKKLLYAAVETNNISLINMYMDNQVKAVETFLCEQIDSEVLKSDLYRSTSIKFEVMSFIIQDRLEIATQTIPSPNLLTMIEGIFDAGGLAFRIEEHQHLHVIKSCDVPNVVNLVWERFSTSKEKLYGICASHIGKYDRSLKLKIVQHFTMNYFGCREICPFCNEGCRYSIHGHTGPHQAISHRPIALKGYIDVKTNIFSVETCESHVASLSKILINKTWICFKDYKQFYAYWDIPPRRSLVNSSVWKWYYANHFKDKTGIIRVPNVWKRIPKQIVLRELL